MAWRPNAGTANCYQKSGSIQSLGWIEHTPHAAPLAETTLAQLIMQTLPALRLPSSSYRQTCRRLIEVQSRNEERLFWRNTPSSALWRFLPSHFLVLMAKALRRWNEGTLTPFLLGRLRLLAELGELRRYRWQLRAAHRDANWRSWKVETTYWQR